MTYGPRFDEALRFAHDLHRDQTRKGVATPYIHHLLGVASLVGEYGGAEDQVIAALLHDGPEDQGGEETLQTIRNKFGDAVADYVEGCTDSFSSPKPPWRPRKEAFIERVRTAPDDVKLIVAADKLHNVRSMIRDYRQLGDRLWKRFTADKDATLWYYDEVLKALDEGWNHPILEELSGEVAQLRTMAGAPDTNR